MRSPPPQSATTPCTWWARWTKPWSCGACGTTRSTSRPRSSEPTRASRSGECGGRDGSLGAPCGRAGVCAPLALGSRAWPERGTVSLQAVSHVFLEDMVLTPGGRGLGDQVVAVYVLFLRAGRMCDAHTHTQAGPETWAHPMDACHAGSCDRFPQGKAEMWRTGPTRGTARGQ